MHDEALRLGSRRDMHLLHLDADGCRSLRNDTAIERQLLYLTRYLWLQITDGSSDFGLLARAADANGVELCELGTQLPVGFPESLDLNLQLGSLLCRGQSIVARVEAAELVDDVHRERAQQREHAQEDQ